MKKYDIVYYGLLLIYICIFLFAEVLVFSRSKWILSDDEKKKEQKSTKKNIYIYVALMIIFPLIEFVIHIFIGNIVPLIRYVVIFLSVSFGLALSTQIFKYYKIAKVKLSKFLSK